MSSSKNSLGTVTMTVVNIDMHKETELTLELKGMNAGNVAGKIVTSKEMNDHNTFEQPEKVKRLMQLVRKSYQYALGDEVT